MERLRAYRNTLIVTAVFVVIYFGMIVASINAVLLWGVFTVAWIAAEWRFASDSPLKAWHWALLIVGLVILGMFVDIAVN